MPPAYCATVCGGTSAFWAFAQNSPLWKNLPEEQDREPILEVNLRESVAFLYAGRAVEDANPVRVLDISQMNVRPVFSHKIQLHAVFSRDYMWVYHIALRVGLKAAFFEHGQTGCIVLIASRVYSIQFQYFKTILHTKRKCYSAVSLPAAGRENGDCQVRQRTDGQADAADDGVVRPPHNDRRPWGVLSGKAIFFKRIRYTPVVAQNRFLFKPGCIQNLIIGFLACGEAKNIVLYIYFSVHFLFIPFPISAARFCRKSGLPPPAQAPRCGERPRRRRARPRASRCRTGCARGSGGAGSRRRRPGHRT